MYYLTSHISFLPQVTQCPTLATGATFSKAQQCSSAKRGEGLIHFSHFLFWRTTFLRLIALISFGNIIYRKISLLPGGATVSHCVWRKNEMGENFWLLTFQLLKQLLCWTENYKCSNARQIYRSPKRKVERIWWTFSTLYYLLVDCLQNMSSLKRDKM